MKPVFVMKAIKKKCKKFEKKNSLIFLMIQTLNDINLVITHSRETFVEFLSCEVNWVYTL